MKRPLLVTGDIFRMQARGGITRYLVELVPRLEREVHVVAGVHRSAEAHALGARLESSFRIPAFRGAMRIAAPLNGLIDRAALARAREAIVHVSYYRDPAAFAAGRPLVVTVHDFTHERTGIDPGDGPERWKHALARRADAIVCYSEASREDCVSYLKVPADRVHVAPLASRHWSEVAATPPPGLDPARPFLLWVGPRYAYKNFRRTLEAWAVSAGREGLDLYCVGGGPLSAGELEPLAGRPVAGRVIQHDASDAELRWAYAHARGLVYPSLCEGFGLPIVEAMALGCPVLTSDRSSMPEVGGEAACYVDPEDTEALAAGLTKLAQDDLRTERGARLREQAARFSWTRCAAAHERVYEAFD